MTQNDIFNDPLMTQASMQREMLQGLALSIGTLRGGGQLGLIPLGMERVHANLLIVKVGKPDQLNDVICFIE